jgi:oxygen-independent coproporphyrinogen-3 oxidase
MEGLAALSGGLLSVGLVPAEITLEANPESADAAFLEACRSNGINRLSLGVQSFHEPSRRAVGRIGEAALLDRRLTAAAEIFGSAAGSGLSLDLMTGLPLQTEDILKGDIDRALAFAPGHVSLYSLTVEAGTPLAGRAKFPEHGVFPPLHGQDEADRLWITGRDALAGAGYGQYEVSNFSLPGRRCAHNIRYWRMENWLGAGSSASGTVIFEKTDPLPCSTPDSILGLRMTYPPDVEAFLAAPESVTEELDRITLIKESLLMGFRYIEGPDPDLFKSRFGLGIEECIPRTLAAWREKYGPGGEPLAVETALTGEGLLFLNAFLLDAFGEVDDRYPK